MGWYDKEENSSGAIAGRLSTDTLSIRGAVGDQMGLIIQNLVTIIGAYVIAFSAGWKMTLVITATVPLLGISAWTNAKFLKGFSTEVERALSYPFMPPTPSCSLTHSLTRPLAHSPTRSLAHSLTRPIFHSPTRSFDHPPAHSPTHQLTHPPSPPPTIHLLFVSRRQAHMHVQGMTHTVTCLV